MTQLRQLSRKKVLFLITKSNWGGAQRYVYDLAIHVPAGWEAVVAFGGTGVAGSQTGRLSEMQKAARIRTVCLPSLARDFGLADMRAFFEILRLLRDERPHVLHLNSSKAGGLGALAGRLARVSRIIYTAHGWPFWEARSILWLFFVRTFSWFTILLAHNTICISNYDLRNAHMPLTASKLQVIRNGLAPIDFLSREEARSALFSPETLVRHKTDVWVVTNAELHPNKNIFAAIDAVAAYNISHTPHVYYVIMSDGELRVPLEHYIAERHLQESVTLLGFVPDARRYMKAFDVFLLTSKKEGVPYVILEAGAANLPVVASNVGGIPEAINGASNVYLVNPTRVSDIVGGLAAAIEHLGSPPKMPLADVIQSRFSQQRMFEQTFKLYQHP